MITQSANASERFQTNQQQCYSDPKLAYQAILDQEKRLENQAQQKVDNVKVNINTATEGELVLLKGIGSSKAQAIVLYREMLGPFITVDELTRVKGIGEKTLAKNRHRLTVQ
ncbi:MAG: ComEA family DNA-binding protein [Psychrobacter sp.]|nr:ComEA family DNA-binding protein [Psychrobacter sp.]